MPEDYLIRRDPHRNYYGYAGNYPRYKGLESGIDMMSGDSIPTGMQSMFDSMIEIEGQKIADEDVRQEKFKSLIDVSLKDVRGKWRDEAVGMRDKFISKAGKLAQESQGHFNWQQTKDLESGKDDLESFVGMAKEVEDWSHQAFQSAMQIQDKTARDATLKNIGKILESGSLKETYNKTLDPNWLITPEESLDWKADIYPDLPLTSTDGVFNKQNVEDAVNAGFARQDPKLMKHYQSYKKKFPNTTPEQYAKLSASWASWYYNSDKSGASGASGGGKKGEYGQDESGREIIIPNEDGYYDVAWMNKGKGIEIASVKDEDTTDAKGNVIPGQRHAGAAIIGIRPQVDPKTGELIVDDEGNVVYDAVIQHDIYKIESNADQKKAWRDMEWMDDKTYNLLVATGMIGGDKYSKDPTKKGEIVIPFNKLLPTIDKKVVLKGLTDQMEEAETEEQKTEKQKTEEDPDGILEEAEKIQKEIDDKKEADAKAKAEADAEQKAEAEGDGAVADSTTTQGTNEVDAVLAEAEEMTKEIDDKKQGDNINKEDEAAIDKRIADAEYAKQYGRDIDGLKYKLRNDPDITPEEAARIFKKARYDFYKKIYKNDSKTLKDLLEIQKDLTKEEQDRMYKEIQHEVYSEKAHKIRPFSRDNGDGSESSVLMATEVYDGKWYSFPTLFPKQANIEKGSRDPKDWMEYGEDNRRGAFNKAKARGELFEFGNDKEAALTFGKGSWKKKSEVATTETQKSISLKDVESEAGLEKWKNAEERDKNKVTQKQVVTTNTELEKLNITRHETKAKGRRTYNSPTTNTMSGIVIHHTGSSATSATKTFTQGDTQAAHFMVDRKGNITQYADVDEVVWGAGASRYKGVESLNDHTIQIELEADFGNDAKKYEGDWRTPAQTKALNELVFALAENLGISVDDIISHKQIRGNYMKHNPKKSKADSVQGKIDTNDMIMESIINDYYARTNKIDVPSKFKDLFKTVSPDQIIDTIPGSDQRISLDLSYLVILPEDSNKVRNEKMAWNKRVDTKRKKANIPLDNPNT